MRSSALVARAATRESFGRPDRTCALHYFVRVLRWMSCPHHVMCTATILTSGAIVRVRASAWRRSARARSVLYGTVVRLRGTVRGTAARCPRCVRSAGPGAAPDPGRFLILLRSKRWGMCSATETRAHLRGYRIFPHKRSSLRNETVTLRINQSASTQPSAPAGCPSHSCTQLEFGYPRLVLGVRCRTISVPTSPALRAPAIALACCFV